MAEREPLGVIGAGWVGLVTATCFAELGHEIWCRDIVPEKIESLRRGEAPMYEPRLADLLERNRERLHFTSEMGDVVANAELLFCCVDTPPTYSGDADLSSVNQVVDELGDSADHAIVMKSTVPVGTGRAVTRRRRDLGYVSNPEFLKEGSAVADFMQPDRVVVGYDESSTRFGDRVATLYAPLEAEIVRTDIASAEMIKLASNAFLATKISFINEIANVSEELGADVAEVARGMGLDERIGPKFLQAGIGFGGSCLVGEETVLARRYGRTTLLSLERLWERLSDDYEADDGVIQPDDLEVLSWFPGEDRPRYMPVMAATRRDYAGDIVKLRTKMGRRVRCTPDHPWVVGNGDPVGELEIKLAQDLTEDDRLPLVQGADGGDRSSVAFAAGGAAESPFTERLPALRSPSRTERSAAVAPEMLDVPCKSARPATTFVGDVHDLADGCNGSARVGSRSASAVADVPALGHRTEGTGPLWVCLASAARAAFRGPVYSLEVPGSHTFVTTGGLVTHNCFPKDVSALKQLAGNTGYHFQLLTAVIEVNELQKRRTIGKLQKHLGSLIGKEIALLGLAFKPNTDDIREATSLVLAARLQGEGADVRVYDPVATERARELLGGATISESALDALDGADAAVLVTEWPEFGELDWAGDVKRRMKAPLVIDGRNFLDGRALRQAGFTYEGVGR